MTQPLIFVETSIHIQRVLASRSLQSKLESHIALITTRLVTSNYVWMGFQRSLIADYAHIHRLRLQHGNWGDVMTHLLSGRRSFRSRSAVRCTEILGLLYKHSLGDWQYALQILDQFLRRRLRILFWSRIMPIDDPIGCDLVTLGITRQADGGYVVADGCRRESAMCDLPDFLNEHRPELSTIMAYLAAHPRSLKDQAKTLRILTEVQTDPRLVLGQNSCWPLGDVIIALQVPANSAIWTLDADFKPLAAALGFSLYDPSISQLGTSAQ